MASGCGMMEKEGNMKRRIWIIVILTIFMAVPTVVRANVQSWHVLVEAEENQTESFYGNGALPESHAAASGEQAVGLYRDGAFVSVDFTVPRAGLYALRIGFRTYYAAQARIMVNGTPYDAGVWADGQGDEPLESGWLERCFYMFLDAGNNTVEIVRDGVYNQDIRIDYFSLSDYDNQVRPSICWEWLMEAEEAQMGGQGAAFCYDLDGEPASGGGCFYNFWNSDMYIDFVYPNIPEEGDYTVTMRYRSINPDTSGIVYLSQDGHNWSEVEIGSYEATEQEDDRRWREKTFTVQLQKGENHLRFQEKQLSENIRALNENVYIDCLTLAGKTQNPDVTDQSQASWHMITPVRLLDHTGAILTETFLEGTQELTAQIQTFNTVQQAQRFYLFAAMRDKTGSLTQVCCDVFETTQIGAAETFELPIKLTQQTETVTVYVWTADHFQPLAPVVVLEKALAGTIE